MGEVQPLRYSRRGGCGTAFRWLDVLEGREWSRHETHIVLLFLSCSEIYFGKSWKWGDKSTMESMV